MFMTTVQSVFLSAFGYDCDSKELCVVFPSGRYIHSGVPQNIYEGLSTAQSKDFFYRRHIAQYPIRKEN